MADEIEDPAQAGQYNEHANEEMAGRNEPLTGNTDGHEGQGEISSNHSHPRHETSRPQEDEADRTRPSCSAEIHDPPQIFRCWHEINQVSEIEDFIYEPAQPPPPRSGLFVPEDADCGAWASPSNPKCPASFGDHGTTATAGAFGQLVQISDYLGAGNSGMFSAGHSFAKEPYLVPRRARNLHRLALETFDQAQRRDYSDVFGLKFLDLELLGEAPPRLKWFQYQWPRYEYQRGRFRGMKNVVLTIQFIARNKTVFQQCILENRGKTDVDLELAFCKDMSIWDLDHVTDDYEFNKKNPNYQKAGPGPGGFGWVHVNQFRKGPSDARADSQHSGHKNRSNDSRDNHHKKDETAHGVALVVSMAVGGEMVKFSAGRHPHIWKQTLKAKSRAFGSRPQKLEIVTAYKLVLLANPLSEWKTFVTPLKNMNPNKLLREAGMVSFFRGSIVSTSRKDDLAYSYDERHSETPNNEDNTGEAGIVNASQGGVVIVDSEPQTGPSPAVDHEPEPERTEPTIDHIDFSIRRNLEHILGVCAIPVAFHMFEEDTDGLVREKLRGVEAIALSCGDLSGHRICTTSSFFAFQFLTEVAKNLSHLSQTGRDGTYIQNLLSRIRDVCLGHLKWLYAAERADSGEAFSSLYWVSGEAVVLPESSETWTPRDHVRDTALHILKAIEFATVFNDDENSELVGEMISPWGQSWLRWLERSDKRESLMWYHKEDEGLKVFRLHDHVWIWRALKAIEDERHGARATLHEGAQHNGRSSSMGSKASHTDGTSRHSHKFASRTVQREVLRKFTTEHEILRKKMIALTRSPRETRFLFHARDTALFYGRHMGFFPDEISFREVWENTIDAQRFHEDNQEARWENALRYGLAIMLGVSGHRINNKEPRYMVRAATELLLRSSSENGIFPGRLDIMTKGQLENVFHKEEHADSCYGAGFEIPYIFLIHTKEIRAFIDNTVEPALERESGDVNLRYHPTRAHPHSTEAMPAHHNGNPQGQVDQREENRELRKLLAKLSDILSDRASLPKSTSASDRTATIELAVDAQLVLKKAIPFSNIIDSHSIVEIEDEWLFNYPGFFGSDKDEDISIDETLSLMEDFDVTWLTSIDLAAIRRKYTSHSKEGGSTDDQSRVSGRRSSSVATEESSADGQSRMSSFQSSSVATLPEDCEFMVVDMPSRKHLQGKGPKNRRVVHVGPFEDIWEQQMCKPRTAARAKKRLIWWCGQDTELGLEAALLCSAASKGDEKASMLEFFERHFRRENFMFDHCNLAYNTWDTELHLSFFALGDASAPLLGDAALNVEMFPGVQGKHISRSSFKFRFHGDAFDRYWTLHMFMDLDRKADPDEEDAFEKLLASDENSTFQRKVLELRLFYGALSLVEFNTKQILAEVKSELGFKSGAFSWSIPSMDKYSSWSTLWEGFAPLIQALANDLTSAQDMIGQWEMREAGRGQERPRWTHNDERKYRAAITRGERVLNWRKRGVQNLLNDVESLRDACTARLANAREEISFRSNQNIASFTFVTIVFLPLGFAASVFGMNGYPARGWVASMAVVAVVALAITATALANAKLLLAVAGQLYADALRLTGAVFQSSLIGQRKRQRDERTQASTTPYNPRDGNQKGDMKPTDGGQKGTERLHSHVTRHVLFWMAYLLIELPARRVALACRALPSSLIHSLGLPRTGIATPPESVVSSTGGSAGPPAAAIGRKVIRITGGIMILPLLLISWTIQLLFYNILDILTVLGRLTRKTLYALVTPSDADGAATDTKIVSWLIDPPPSVRPVRNFMSRDEKSEKPPPQAEGPVATDRSDAGSPEEV